MGALRLRPRRALHELHGPLRLRGDGREGDHGQPARRHSRRTRHDGGTERLSARACCRTDGARSAARPRAEACGAGAAAGACVDRAPARLARTTPCSSPASAAASIPRSRPAPSWSRGACCDAAGRSIDADARVLDAVRHALRDRRQPFVSSSLLTVEGPLAGKVARTDAWNTHGAAGVDMETYGVAAAAIRHGVAWMAVRVVLDPAGVALPASLASWHDESDERAIMRTALRRPLRVAHVRPPRAPDAHGDEGARALGASRRRGRRIAARGRGRRLPHGRDHRARLSRDGRRV